MSDHDPAKGARPSALRVIDGPYTKNLTDRLPPTTMDIALLLHQSRLCAEALEYNVVSYNNYGQSDPYNVWCLSRDGEVPWIFDPFHNDSQFLRLEEWLISNAYRIEMDREWVYYWMDRVEKPLILRSGSPEGRRSAIIECVAKVFEQQKATKNRGMGD